MCKFLPPLPFMGEVARDGEGELSREVDACGATEKDFCNGITCDAYARSIYSPLSVLIFIFSPCRTKGGTMTTKPVSIVAGL
jgi:hypothetical protein